MLTYVQDVRSELSKVTWPDRRNVIRLTLVVLTISVVVGLYIGALDFIFAKLLELAVQ